MKYIIAVTNAIDEGEFFEFEKEEDRSAFIEDIIKIKPDVQYATAELPECQYCGRDHKTGDCL